MTVHRVIGIDIGQARSRAVVVDAAGSRLAVDVASAVGLTTEGSAVVGDEASALSQLSPDRVATSFVEDLGRAEPVVIGGTPYGIEALVAQMVRHAVDTATPPGVPAPATIALAVPATIDSEYAVDLLRQAARLAAVGDVDLVGEDELAAQSGAGLAERAAWWAWQKGRGDAVPTTLGRTGSPITDRRVLIGTAAGGIAGIGAVGAGATSAGAGTAGRTMGDFAGEGGKSLGEFAGEGGKSLGDLAGEGGKSLGDLAGGPQPAPSPPPAAPSVPPARPPRLRLPKAPAAVAVATVATVAIVAGGLAFAARDDSPAPQLDAATTTSAVEEPSPTTTIRPRVAVSSFTPSPGPKIAYVSNEGLQESDSHIWVMNADGSNPTDISGSSAYRDTEPAWSPDGTKIAFSSQRGNSYDIWVMNADGSGQTNLTKAPPGLSPASPAWSPDGKRIVFSGQTQGLSNGEVFIINADGSNVVQLTNTPTSDPGGDEAHPSWSPDGTKLAFAEGQMCGHGAGMFVMEADGSNRIEVSSNAQNQNSCEDLPTWSPDGRKLAFVTGGRIAIVNADGSSLTSHSFVTTSVRVFKGATWSPDGSQFAFAGENGNISVIGIDGTGERELTTSTAIESQPAWTAGAQSP